MHNRRKFLIQSSLAAGAVALSKPFQSLASAPHTSLLGFANTIHIFHTNDLHGKVNAAFDNLGGIKNIKLTLENKDKAIVIDAGDFTHAKNTLQQDIGVITVMNNAGYVAATIGNNDVAKGQQHLVDLIKEMKFSLVNCNYEFDNIDLQSMVKQYTVINYGRFKVGITGVGCKPDQYLKANDKITFNDPYTKANEVAKYLKRELNCDLVICLSHLGHSKTTSYNKYKK